MQITYVQNSRKFHTHSQQNVAADIVFMHSNAVNHAGSVL